MHVTLSQNQQWLPRSPRALEQVVDAHGRYEQFFANRFQTLFDSSDSSLIGQDLQHLPHYDSLKDLKKSVHRTLLAMDRQEPITIFADYDVDGTASCAMLRTFFECIGYPVRCYIPERLVEGYGLNVVGLKKISELGGGLVITVDNGIAAVEACELALQLGIDVIVTDHHDLPHVLPKAYAIVNPKQSDCLYPYKMLAGVGVAFYFMCGLRAALRERGLLKAQKLNLRSMLDFVALATIADLAPLNGVNHTLCRIGLQVLRENVLSGQRPGLHALLQVCGWNADGPVSSYDVAFKLAPRLNAAGRLGAAQAAEQLLFTQSTEEALRLAKFLDAENSKRQEIEKSMCAEAYTKVTDHLQSLQPKLPSALVLFSEHWHTGVAGIVASRVLDKYYLPTLILGVQDGKIKGSGRSTHDFDLFAALNRVRDELDSFGGHFHAVGLTIKPEKLQWLQNYLDEYACTIFGDAAHVGKPCYYDGTLKLNQLTLEFVNLLQQLEPYGMGNPKPVWFIGDVRICKINRVGKRGGDHAKVLLVDDSGQMWFMAFEKASVLESCIAMDASWDVLVEAKLSYWMGKWEPELRIVTIKIHQKFLTN